MYGLSTTCASIRSDSGCHDDQSAIFPRTVGDEATASRSDTIRGIETVERAAVS